MKINRIKIYNISSYAGECSFDFNVDKEKNIVLIGGQNGTGKTSLFTALKLALYGHLCFNYQSVNSQYFSKIKGLINHDAFKDKDVRAFVEVEIEIPNEREVVKYTILREWEYLDKKLSEKLNVFQGEKELKEDEISFFQNYLFTILPPNLFDFFFFDGEQIADFFATHNYNNYVKNALLTLCSFDTFELIHKFCNNYVASYNTSENDDELNFRYQDVINRINELESNIDKKRKDIECLNSELNEVGIKKEDIEASIKNAGGLREDEKEELLKESKEYENMKSVSTVYIKSFIENMMPFIIAKDLTWKLKEQLAKEEELRKYMALQEKMISAKMIDVITQTMNKFNYSGLQSEFISELTAAISDTVKPEFDIKSFNVLHDLSREQQMKVDEVLRNIDKLKDESILKNIDIKEVATKKTIDINKRLREALSEKDKEIYTKKLSELAKTEFELKNQIQIKEKEILSDTELLEKTNLQKSDLLEKLKENAKNRNIYNLTEKVSKIMDYMNYELMLDKFKEIEGEMLSILKSMLRKGNFIDLVEIDEDFNIYLYKKQLYKIGDIENLIANIGYEELAKRIGNKGIKKLTKELNIEHIEEIRKMLKKQGNQVGMFEGDEIELYSQLEFNQLSKGEKQIFILSLYYAIIKVSGQEVPFIIDTPYARIDTKHREQISKKYFPNISNQVIILSTDEEITQNYYSFIKPYISKEYLLQYNDSRTTAIEGYFFAG